MKRAVDSRSDRRPFAQSLSLSVSPAQTRSTALSSAGSPLDQAATSKIDNRHVWPYRMVRARNRPSESLYYANGVHCVAKTFSTFSSPPSILVQVLSLVMIQEAYGRRIAGGGARTHTILRSLDFESNVLPIVSTFVGRWLANRIPQKRSHFTFHAIRLL